MNKKNQTFSLWRVLKTVTLFLLALYLLMLIVVFEISIFLVIIIIILGFLFKKRFFLLFKKINEKSLILGGIIIVLVLSNLYFIDQCNQVDNLYNKSRKLEINEYQFSFISSIGHYPFGDYCNCDSWLLCDNYDHDCYVRSVMDCENSCGECIEEQNECAEKYNECVDDYNDLVGQIDKIIN